MQNIYIVRTKDRRVHCFYHANESGINLRTYEHSKWGQAINVVPDASPNYTVTLDDGLFYIFCSDSAGNIHLCKSNPNDSNWTIQLILRNQSPVVHTVIFYPMVTKDGMKLIYNVPSPEDKTHFIMIQQLYQNGEWGTPSRLDRITALQHNIYTMQKTSSDHMLLFYQTKTPETSLGYREISGDLVSDFTSFHATTYQIIDATFLTSASSIHALYIVKSMFSAQLVYRKRDAKGFSLPVTIWETQRMENCAIYIISNTLYVSFCSAGHLYIAQSDDGGLTFTRPARYKNNFCKTPVRAAYISEIEMNEWHYACREVYVDRYSPFDIQILPDMISNFYPSEHEQAPVSMPAPAAAPEPPKEVRSESGYIYTDHYDPFANMPSAADLSKRNQPPEPMVEAAAYYPFAAAQKPYEPPKQPRPQEKEPPTESKNVTVLRNSLQAALQQNASKDQQLNSLTSLVASKNREIKTIEKSHQDTRSMMQRQIERYKSEIEKLKLELSKARKEADTYINREIHEKIYSNDEGNGDPEKNTDRALD